MKLTDYVTEFLVKKGVECMFVFTGGAIAHFIDSVYTNYLNNNTLKPICVMHEQAGSMAADGYTRATGKISAVAVTSGPGATNLITGIACSYYDSIPGLYFTGQVRMNEYSGDNKQRQTGFQETDIVRVVKPITNYAVMVTDPKKIKYELEKSFWMALNGRPGPVLIDLPMDIQWAEINPDELKGFEPPIKQDKKELNISKINESILMIKNSKRPMIISGGGIRNAKAINELKELANLLELPVAVTFNGVDTFDHDNPLYSGVVGLMGNKGTNKSIKNSDLIIAIGTRLMLRQVKNKPETFPPNGKLIHVDIDSNELNQRVKSDIAMDIDAKEFIVLLLNELKKENLKFTEWAKTARKNFEDNPFCKPEYYKEKNGVNQYVFYKELAEQMSDDAILVADAGQNVMWAMQSTKIRAKQRLFTAAAHSPMGYAFPAAMGVLAGWKNSPKVICTIGDGGMQLNIQELQTIHKYKLPLKIFIMNNYAYGAIMDFQDADLEKRYYASSTEYGYSIPDFLAIALAYKIPTFEIDSQEKLGEKIKKVLEMKGPVVCNVKLIPRTYVTLDI